MKHTIEITKDLVSIIIPYYRKKKYIQKTINSILNQSYNHYEIIIVYDDENLSELSYLEGLFKSYKKIRILKNSQTVGAGFSRNRGVENAKGEFIAFIDADDIWKKLKLESQINFMKQENLKITHTSYEIIDKNDKVLGERISRNFGFDFEKKNPLINDFMVTLLEIQKDQIFHCTKELIKKNNIKSNTPIVSCGIGQNIIENKSVQMNKKLYFFKLRLYLAKFWPFLHQK